MLFFKLYFLIASQLFKMCVQIYKEFLVWQIYFKYFSKFLVLHQKLSNSKIISMQIKGYYHKKDVVLCKNFTLYNMFNKNIKLIAAFALFALAVWQFTDSQIGNGIMLLLLTAIPVLLYFKNEIILAVMFKLKKQDMDGANRLLAKIKNPETALTKKQLGYWNFLKGQFEYQTTPLKAEKYLRKAVDLGLNFDHDMAAAKLFLAGIVASKNRKIEANKLLKEAEQLDKHGMLGDQIKMMKQQMKRANVPNHNRSRNQRRR